MSTKTENGTYRARKRMWIDGKYVRISKTFKSKTAANIFEAQAEVAKRKKEPPQVVSAQVPPSVVPPVSNETFREFAARWHEEYCKVEKVEGQWTEDRNVIRDYLVPAFGDVPMAELRQRHLRILRKSLLERKTKSGKSVIKPKTANNVLTLAKTIVATAVDWEELPKNPFRKVKLLRVPKQEFGYWAAEERDAFVRVAKSHDPLLTRIVVLACNTGMRRGELAGLKRSQLDFKRRIIVVSGSYCYKSGKRVDRTKNGEIDAIPMNDAAYEALAPYRFLKPDALVFGPTVLIHASRVFKRLCERVGARPIRFHDLRHTFASCLVMAGVPLYTVQKLMRHKSIAMTEKYAHLAPNYLAKAAAALISSGPDLGPPTLGGLLSAENSGENLEPVSGFEPDQRYFVKTNKIA